MTRSAVENRFIEAGGLSFGNETSYIYRKCSYIALKITFKPVMAGQKSGLDQVESVGILTIKYEARD